MVWGGFKCVVSNEELVEVIALLYSFLYFVRSSHKVGLL